MKYIVDLPDNMIIKSALNGLTLGIPMSVSSTQKEYVIPTNLQLDPHIEPDRKAIEDEVWEFLAFLINEMDTDDKDKCFGMLSIYKIVSTMSYQEAKSKYEEWLKQKDEIHKDEIHVGDEIVGIYSDGEISPPLVVLKVEGNYYYGIYSKTGDFIQGGLNYEKTGRHFPEVAELLEKMRG